MTKKQEIEELWRVCFNDADEFIRLYFDEVYKEDHALVIEKQGRIVSSLQLLPYSVWMEGKEIPLAYIAGVCTHPSEQKKGYMNQLMREADDWLIHRNIPLAALIPAEPWLFDVYRKYGYSEAFYYSTACYLPASLPPQNHYRVRVAPPSCPGLYPYFDKKLKERSACVLHSEADFQVILKDLALDDGSVFVAENREGELSGMAFASPGNEGDVFIAELLFDDDFAKEQLLHTVTRFFNARKALYVTPSESAELQPKGMAKRIDENYFRTMNIDIESLFSRKPASMSLMLD